MPGKDGSRYQKVAVNWYVSAKSTDRSVEGVTKEISPRQAYICCAKPFRLNEVLDVVITTPERHLQVSAEVVWSNIYGYDDEITPRGMGIRFVNITEEDQELITDAIREDDVGTVASEYIESLEMDIGEN